MNVEDPNHEQKDEQEALFSQNGRPSEILSKIEHQEDEYNEGLEEEAITHQVQIVVE